MVGKAGRSGRMSQLQKDAVRRQAEDREKQLLADMGPEAAAVAGEVGVVGQDAVLAAIRASGRKRKTAVVAGKASELVSVPLFGRDEDPARVAEAEQIRMAMEREAERDADVRSFRMGKAEAVERGLGQACEVTRAEIAWVGQALCVSDLRPVDAPSLLAWNLLAWARDEPDKFYTVMFPKALPKEEEGEVARLNRDTLQSQEALLDRLMVYVGQGE